MIEIVVNSSLVEGSTLRTVLGDNGLMISMTIDEVLKNGSFNKSSIRLSRRDFLRSVEPILQGLGIKMSSDKEAI